MNTDVCTDSEMIHLRELAKKARFEHEDNIRKDKHNREHPDDIQPTSIRALLAYENFLFKVIESIEYV